ncbi:MAG: hypothetical protein HYZ74_03595, partial [Elusimicrobia bacterium]|nr:hypothetical protein [Elusimicrobiota bacterium]
AAPAPVPAPGPANPTIAALLSAMGSAPSSSQMVLPAPGARAAAPPAPAAAAPAPVPPPPSAPPLPVAAAPATTASPAIDNPGLGVLQTWTPPGVEAPSAQDALLPIPAPPAAPAPPAPRDASPAEFDAFLANGPYSREGQALLKILAEKAPDFCRAILRRTVVRGAPLIVFDGARTGLDRRAGFAPTAAGESPVIALSPGAVLVERRSGLFRRSLIAVPEDPRAWSDLGIPAPLAQAAVKDAVASSREAGAWGETKIYPDRSRRGSYTPQQQAGELLERLLLLGLEREGFASSTYAARAWARAARLLFSARIAEDYGNDSFLDPDRRLELREWIERGDEADDMLIAAWSSSRGNVLDPRRGGPESQARYERQSRESCSRALLADHLAEAARGFVARARTLEALNEGDLLSGDAAKKAAEKVAAAEAAARKALLASPPSCDGRFGADEAGLRRSAALLAEASRSERAFRERKMKGLGYAPRD